MGTKNRYLPPNVKLNACEVLESVLAIGNVSHVITAEVSVANASLLQLPLDQLQVVEWRAAGGQHQVLPDDRRARTQGRCQPAGTSQGWDQGEGCSLLLRSAGSNVHGRRIGDD